MTHGLVVWVRACPVLEVQVLGQWVCVLGLFSLGLWVCVFQVLEVPARSRVPPLTDGHVTHGRGLVWVSALLDVPGS